MLHNGVRITDASHVSRHIGRTFGAQPFLTKDTWNTINSTDLPRQTDTELHLTDCR